MRNLILVRPALAFWAWCFLPACLLHAAEPASQDMLLWYRQPATQWRQGIPLGNGMIGAMVFGGVPQERIALNESSFWSGRPHNYDDPNAGKYFEKIRDLVFAGKHQEATDLTNEHFRGIPFAQEAFQPIGDLILSFPDDTVTDYRRELNMETGVAKVSYRLGDAVITRETFVSWPDKVLVTRVSSDKPGRISFEAQFKGPYMVTSVADSGRLVVDGIWKGPFPPPRPGNPMQIARTGGTGLRYQASLIARLKGGKSEADGSTLKITNADSVTLVLAIATSSVNYKDISGDPAAKCKNVLDDAAGKDYVTLYRRHVDDFTNLMNRVHLSLDTPASTEPTDQRLRAVRNGARDISLEALCFQFGRYLLISSSRAGGQPANLQGIWNEAVLPPWDSKHTININTEMNYWPVGIANLGETIEPLTAMVEDMQVTGGKVAKVMYGARGWVAHHNTDLWRATGPIDYAFSGMWPCGGFEVAMPWKDGRLVDVTMRSLTGGLCRLRYGAVTKDLNLAKGQRAQRDGIQ